MRLRVFFYLWKLNFWIFEQNPIKFILQVENRALQIYDSLAQVIDLLFFLNNYLMYLFREPIISLLTKNSLAFSRWSKIKIAVYPFQLGLKSFLFLRKAFVLSLFDF